MEKVIYITNRQNVKMAVKINVSPQRKKCAFLEHGLGARKEYPHMKVLEEYFANNGFNVVNIDATNSLNESGQTKDGITFTGHYEDLEDVIEWAKTQEFYKEPFALAGQSLGAASCLKYAGKFPHKVNTLIVAACPFIDGNKLVDADPMMQEIAKNGFYDKVSKSTGKTLHITKAFNEDLKNQNLTPYIANVVADTCVIQGMLDSKFIQENSQKILEMLNCKKELMLLPGVPHDLANTPETEKEFRKCLDYIFAKLNFGLTFKQVCKDNLETAIQIQKTLFPLEEGRWDLIDSVNNTIPTHIFLQKYWVAYYGEKPVGISGLYAYKAHPKDAWLGWFGVLQEYREKGFGRQIFEFAKDEAKRLGFENLRLYTDEEDNRIATKLYEKLGMEKEFYENKEDKFYTASRVLIYSMSLVGKPCEKWNSKFLSLGIHEKRNEE